MNNATSNPEGSGDLASLGPSPLSRSTFVLLVALLCVFYLAIEFVYLERTEFNPDEAQGAHSAHRLLSELPYRDFKPYKTALGHYLQLPATVIASDTWSGYRLIRVENVLITAAFLAWAAFALARHYRPEAVCLALLLLVTMTNFAERSFEIRVDMLSALLGLAGLLMLLERRFAWAGVLCGLSFLMTQKGVYFFAASNAALLGWFMVCRDRQAFGHGVAFNTGAATVVGLYLGFWYVIAAGKPVSGATFASHYNIAFTHLYDYLLDYWVQTLRRNPFFYAIALVHLFQLALWRLKGPANFREQTLLIYSLGLLACCMWHRQPWPYFFVLLAPTIMVLHASFFHRFLPALQGAQQFVVLLFVLMALLPLTRLEVTLKRDNGFQRHMVELASDFLEPGETYVDGIELLYDRPQQVKALRWLDTARLRSIHAKGADFHQAILDELESRPVKLVIRNWRLIRLPTVIQTYLATHFARLWGNIHTYAPTVHPHDKLVDLKFAGTYRILAQGPAGLTIEGADYAQGDQLRLSQGRHSVQASSVLSLQFLPDGWEAKVKAPYEAERPGFMLYRHPE